jgi:hypothetical protein
MKIADHLPTSKSRAASMPLSQGLHRVLLLVLAFVAITLLAGCNGSNSTTVIIVPTPTVAPTPTPTATPTSTPTSTPSPTPVPLSNNASVFAVDCKTQRAYVPLLFLGSDGNGEVAELDLSVDPDVTDPRVAVISTEIPDLPVSAAADSIHAEILLANEDEEQTGMMSVILESNNKLVSFPFPSGSAPSPTDGVVYDPLLNLSVVSMSDALLSCASPGTCSGTALFDASTGVFTDFNQFTPATNFAVDFNRATALLNSLKVSPDVNALDLSNNSACSFSDLNLTALDAEPDGAAVDPATGIWVTGNFLSPKATVINLNGSTFSAAPGCMLTEGGTPPNSINFDTGTGANMPGVAINSVTHQALLTAVVSKQIALLTLPSAPVPQLTSAMVTGVQTSVPDDPSGDDWTSASFPYAVVADVCHNFGYVLNQQRDFLVQIDLTQFQSNPAAIATALTSGHCAGTTTPFSCDNNNGVKFFPLPGVK